MRQRWMGIFLAGCTAGLGCSTVQVTRRDNCWVKQSEGFLKRLHEEVGPCSRPEPKWADDRIARLVQECVAEADYRWQTEAIVAWNHGQTLPPQKPEATVMGQCLGHAANALVTENETLKQRMNELLNERQELQSTVKEDRVHLRETETHMTDALGEAAKKPAPSAVATSNSTGTASTQADQTAPTALPTLAPPTKAGPAIEKLAPEPKCEHLEGTHACLPTRRSP